MLKLFVRHQSRRWQPTHQKNFLLEVQRLYGRYESQLAASEAWAWLVNRGFLCQSPDQDLGWFVVSRAGLEAAEADDVPAWAEERSFPDSLIHPDIRATCADLFRQGRFDTAVFEAFKTVEVAIRSAGRFGPDLIGMKLTSRAFNPEDGPLTDLNAEAGERQALMQLMGGAIGSYKNPQSHRHVGVAASEAREMIILASHLLRIVDDRSHLRARTA